MRFRDPLDTVLGQLSKVRVLRFLVMSEGERAGREIARSVALSHPIVHRSLQDLAAQGLVASRRAGGALLYRTNPNHWLVKELLGPLFAKEREALRALGVFLLKRLQAPDASLILFGSVARGEERPDSDLDLLVILPDQGRRKTIEAEVFDLASEVSRAFGNRLAPVILTRLEFRERFRRRERWIRSVLKEGQVIAGRPLSDLVPGHGR